MRVLLTGGYGCIGAWISATCSPAATRSGSTTSRKTPGGCASSCPRRRCARSRFVQGDVTDLAAPQRRPRRARHHARRPPRRAAGADLPGRPDPRGEGQRPRHAGRLRGGQAAGEQVQRLVYASSAAVFGPPDEYPAGPLADDVPLTPTHPLRRTSSAATRATPASTSRTTASPASACGRGPSTASAATSA